MRRGHRARRATRGGSHRRGHPGDRRLRPGRGPAGQVPPTVSGGNRGAARQHGGRSAHRRGRRSPGRQRRPGLVDADDPSAGQTDRRRARLYSRSSASARARQIVVNAAGRRFADEALPYNEFGKAMNDPGVNSDYPNGAAWMIFDEGFRRRYTFPAARPGADLPGWALRAGSVAELARKAGVTRGRARGHHRPMERRLRGRRGPVLRPRPERLRTFHGRSGAAGHRTWARSTSRPTTRSGCSAAPSAPRGDQSPTPAPGCSPRPGARLPACTPRATPRPSGPPTATRARATLGIAMTMGYLAGRRAAALP